MSLCTLMRPHVERSGREDQDYFVLRSLVMSLHFLFSVQLARDPLLLFYRWENRGHSPRFSLPKATV